ncbi:MAG: hypothetical protein MK078_01145 [Crocinitomicaceae bacterium]|nr:hypothetical protein [Crocinitomicaceae bacterium]
MLEPEEILDSSDEANKSSNFHIKNWVVIFVLSIGMAICYSYGIIFSGPVLTALITIILSSLLTWFYPKYGVLATTLICIGVMLGTLQFFPMTRRFGFGIFGLSISFEVYSLLLFIIHVVLNIYQIKTPFIKEENKKAG